MIAYFYCLCSAARKAQAELVKARGYRVIVVKDNQQALLEAKKYQTRMPFTVTNGKAERI